MCGSDQIRQQKKNPLTTVEVRMHVVFSTWLDPLRSAKLSRRGERDGLAQSVEARISNQQPHLTKQPTLPWQDDCDPPTRRGNWQACQSSREHPAESEGWDARRVRPATVQPAWSPVTAHLLPISVQGQLRFSALDSPFKQSIGDQDQI